MCQSRQNDTLIWTALSDTNRFEVKVAVQGNYAGMDLYFGLYDRYGHFYIQTPRLGKIYNSLYEASNVWTSRSYDLVEAVVILFNPSITPGNKIYDNETDLLKDAKIIKKMPIDLLKGRIELYSEKTRNPVLKRKLKGIEYNSPYQDLKISVSQLYSALKESNLNNEKDLIGQLVLKAAGSIIDQYNSVFISDSSFVVGKKDYEPLLRILFDAVTQNWADYDPYTRNRIFEQVGILKQSTLVSDKKGISNLDNKVLSDFEKLKQSYSDLVGNSLFFNYFSNKKKLLTDTLKRWNPDFTGRRMKDCPVDTVMKRLKKNELLVHYFLSENKIIAFIISDSLFLVKDICTRGRLDSIITFNNNKWNIEDSELINRQYNNPELGIVWKPVNDVLEKNPLINRIYIWPVYSLNYLNFSGISINGKWRLIDKYEIFNCQGYNFDTELMPVQNAVLIGGIDYFYSAKKGLSHNSSEESKSFPPLVYSKIEYDYIKKMFQEKSIPVVLLNDTVCEKDFRNVVFRGQADLLYFSGHTLSKNQEKNPEECVSSAFVLSGINMQIKKVRNIGELLLVRNSTKFDEMVTFYELLNESNAMHYNYVFLNSCESSLGSFLPFENQPRSLKAAFKLKADPKAIISTIQSVDDVYGKEFSLSFFEHLIGKNKNSGIRESFYQTQQYMHQKYPDDVSTWVGFTLTF